MSTISFGCSWYLGSRSENWPSTGKHINTNANASFIRVRESTGSGFLAMCQVSERITLFTRVLLKHAVEPTGNRIAALIKHASKEVSACFFDQRGDSFDLVLRCAAGFDNEHYTFGAARNCKHS